VRLTNGDRPRAQDVVQETLLRAWRNPAILDQTQGSARTWVFTVARNLVIDEWRTRRAQLEVATAEPLNARRSATRRTSCCGPGSSPTL